MADDKKIIFSMVGVSKMFPPHKQVLKDIYLSFFYGAKIGIIGLNGSGKSTLLKIIAGVEKSYQGEVVFSPGYSVGYLEQEPKLDPEKTVKEVVQEGVQPILDLLAEYEKVNESFGDPDVLENPDKMEALIARQAELQDHIDASDAWNIDNKLERAMDALRCPPEDQLVKFLSGGERRRWHCAVCCCNSLIFCYSTNLPTTSMPSRSIGWNSICAISRYGYCHYPRPLFPRPRGRVDSRTRSGRRYSLAGKLYLVAGTENQTYGDGGETGEQAA